MSRQLSGKEKTPVLDIHPSIPDCYYSKYLSRLFDKKLNLQKLLQT